MSRRSQQRRGSLPLAGDTLARTRYGLSAKAVASMLHSQAGACAICGRPIDGSAVVVDHDHLLAATHPHADDRGCRACVRQLLCNDCNLMLGHARDSPDVLRAAAAYVAMWRDARGG